MARTARASVGDLCYHVLNRGNGRAEVFHTSEDYAAFLELLTAAKRRLPLRRLSYAMMPNHFHLVLRPYGDGDLSRWMQWLLTTHVRRYPGLLTDWPVPCPPDWLAAVNAAQTDVELAALRRSVDRGTPFGDPKWSERTAKRLGLEPSLRPHDRPRKVIK